MNFSDASGSQKYDLLVAPAHPSLQRKFEAGAITWVKERFVNESVLGIEMIGTFVFHDSGTR